MTNQHPLTDAKCREIANNLCLRWPPYIDQGEVLYGEDDLRAAADWQLEQVKKWLKSNTAHYAGAGCYFHTESFLADFKKAMRPTTTQEDTND